MTGKYETWSENALLAEINHRRLVVNAHSSPDEVQRKNRLIEILEGNDRYRKDLAELVRSYL